jgi:hypothetical protein
MLALIVMGCKIPPSKIKTNGLIKECIFSTVCCLPRSYGGNEATQANKNIQTEKKVILRNKDNSSVKL